MLKYDYLIIGGSLAADAAIKAIRKEDKNSSIGLLSDEPSPPYRRPLLSKNLWQTDDFKQIWLGTEKQGVDIKLSTKAADLDLADKVVTDAKGQQYAFGKLLISTGVSPRRFDPRCGDVDYFRTLDDFKKIHARMSRLKSFAIIGGGFVGMELAACLNQLGKEVSMIFPEFSLGCLVFPRELSEYVQNYYVQKGVKIYSGELVDHIMESGGIHSITFRSGNIIYADEVIASIGCKPNVQLANEGKLRVDNGIVAEEDLTCGHPDIFTAGDVANFYNPILKKRMRVEHADNAVMMGRHAGQCMMGHKAPYDHIPSFYSDMFDLKMKAVGEIKSSLDIKAEWITPFEEGTLYYMCDGNINGVLYWNVPAQYDVARSIIKESCGK